MRSCCLATKIRRTARTVRAQQVLADFSPRRAANSFAREVVAGFYCALDPQTPTRVRGILLAALAYFVMPFDVIPDIFAVVGYTDDVAVLTAAFAMINGHIRPRHFEAADRALADERDTRKTV